MRRFIIVLVLLLLFSVTGFAELSDGILGLVENLRFKHYGERHDIAGLLWTEGAITLAFDEPEPIIIVDFIKVKGKQLKVGWEVWINDKCYCVLLIEKED